MRVGNQRTTIYNKVRAIEQICVTDNTPKSNYLKSLIGKSLKSLVINIGFES